MAIDMGKMAGPLPVGAWVAVVGGGLAFMLYTRRQSAASAATSPDSTTAVDNTSGDPGVGVGGSGMYWQDVAPSADGTSGVAPSTITDNDTWGTTATNFLIAQGYDPAVSDSAVRKYLNASRLSSQEYALIKIALAHLGAPPVPLPPPIFGPPKLPKPPAKPTQHKRPPQHKPAKPAGKFRYYTVRPGDTLTHIGQRTHVPWQQIFSANRSGHRREDGKNGMISNPNVIHVGWRLLIP